MFRTTRRYSLVTLTVCAGLLGAAAPAVAHPAPFLVDGPFSAKAPSGVVTDNKDPDKLSARHANSLSDALVAADFEYKEITG